MAGQQPSGSTPVKRKAPEDGDTFSPRAKERLTFNYWSSRKVPKIVAQDLQQVKLAQLKKGRNFPGTISVLCYAVYEGPRVVKIAATDGENNIVIADFEGSKLRGCSKGNIYTLSGFDVQDEKPEYSIGAPNGLQIICSETTVITQSTEEGPSINYSFVDIGKVNMMPPNTRVDVLGVMVKDWGVATVGTIYKKRNMSLTDKSMLTINLSVWGDQAINLKWIEGQVVAVRQAVVKSYENLIYLDTNWWTHIEASPMLNEAEDLQAWFLEKQEED